MRVENPGREPDGHAGTRHENKGVIKADNSAGEVASNRVQEGGNKRETGNKEEEGGNDARLVQGDLMRERAVPQNDSQIRRGGHDTGNKPCSHGIAVPRGELLTKKLANHRGKKYGCAFDETAMIEETETGAGKAGRQEEHPTFVKGRCGEDSIQGGVGIFDENCRGKVEDKAVEGVDAGRVCAHCALLGNHCAVGSARVAGDGNRGVCLADVHGVHTDRVPEALHGDFCAVGRGAGAKQECSETQNDVRLVGESVVGERHGVGVLNGGIFCVGGVGERNVKIVRGVCGVVWVGGV